MLPTLPSISDAQTLMRQGKLRPSDLVEHCLGRIHQFEDQIHAWVMVDEEGARAEALRLGKMLDDGQEPVGPLHGIPIGIKDIIDVAGWPTLCGSQLREGHVAEKDAAVVASLRKAGAIILGKTVTTEWASFDPPPTRNPWNLNHTPGGSSSGSAAAVAMEMCMAALGTQTGGSIVRPASYCGVVGFKPEFGVLGLNGIFPFSRNLDHVGPMGRSVADVEILYHAMERARSESRSAYPLCLYFLKNGFLQEADAVTAECLKSARAKLSADFEITDLSLPNCFQEIHALHRCVMAVEAAEVHRETYEENPESYPVQIRTLIEEGRRASALDYARALRLQDKFKMEFLFGIHRQLQQFSIFVMPSTATAAPGIETTGNPIFNSPWSFLGQPAITIPMGTTPNGLPLGLQLITFMYTSTAKYFETIRRIEDLIGFSAHPNLLTGRFSQF